MKRFILILSILCFFVSCTADRKFTSNQRFTKIRIDTLLTENLNCRALAIDNNKVWYAGSNGIYGYLSLDSSPNFRGIVVKDNLKIEFRSIAQTTKYVFILCVGNPALLYRIAKDGSEIKLVYQEKHPKVFYDSMQFLNNLEGFAIGDPIDKCPSMIQTIDGGLTWKKKSCDDLPQFEPGEAFFAASNTNLIVKDDFMWMVSGGTDARVFRSQDKGNTWEIFDTPIVQGQAMTGIFTADFYDEKIGFVAGGDYLKLLQNYKNKASTKDGGKTWKLIDDNKSFGYASCAQYFPNSGGKSLIVVGTSGIYYYRNRERKWKKLSNDKDFYTIRFIDQKTAIAAGKNRIVKITFI
jgi:photosystem II stability/assembly factor-like uncharacterized protein